jgi:glucose-1-phosphate thymidylyltransferase
VALGFPDILFAADDAFSRAIDHQARSGADVVLGLFPADRPQAVDVVALDASARVTRIVPKPRQTELAHTWGLAVWTPAFTEFLHESLGRRPVPVGGVGELFVGDVIQDSIRSGMKVEGIHVSDAPYLDIGTPETLARVLREGWPRPPGTTRGARPAKRE